MGGVGSVGVVVAAPVFDDHAGFEQGVEAPRVEQLHPAMPGRLGDLQMAAHLVEFPARRQQLVALGKLADDLIRRVPAALLRCHVVADSSCPDIRATESHNDWTTPKGSPQTDNMGSIFGRRWHIAVPAAVAAPPGIVTLARPPEDRASYEP